MKSIFSNLIIKPIILLFLIAYSHASFGQELYKMRRNVSSRLISFENMSGAKGNGGKENDGAKAMLLKPLCPEQQEP